MRISSELKRRSEATVAGLLSRVTVLVVFSAALVVGFGVYATRSLSTLNDGSKYVGHAERVRLQLAQVQQSISDIGQGLRRFQLSLDERAMSNSYAASDALPGELATLKALTDDDPQQQASIKLLTAVANERQALINDQLELARKGDDAAIESIVASGKSTRLLNDCRAIIDRMQARESARLVVHRDAAARAAETVQFTINGGVGLDVILLVLVAYVTLHQSARLRRVQDELAATLRSVGDAVISTDESGTVRFMNSVAERLTGWPTSDAHGRPLAEVFVILDEETRESAESPVTRVLRERRVVEFANHTILRARDLSERPIEDSGAPIYDQNGQLTGVVLVFRDASAQRLAQRALERSESALREADRRKDVFLATLSHELRNPLAPIRTAAQLLESPALTTDDLQRSRNIIARQVRHMATLLDDLLDVSRITRGVLVLRRAPTELCSLLDAAVEAARPAITAKRQNLSIETPETDLIIDVDSVRMTQVVTNLLTNAAKYTDPEGSITLSWRVSADSLIIAVRDTGIGIAPHMLTQVFEMFSQVVPDGEHTDKGLGIGLALVKGFVELHGGRVEVISAGLERGSEFFVYLPASLIVSQSAAKIAQPTMTPNTPSAPLRVLIADDNVDSAVSLAMLLELSGHEIFLAHTGIDALTIAADKRPDAALLDIGMPGMTGYEVARKIRSEPWGQNMMLIAITGWGQEDNKRAAREAGFDHHLTKPMDPDVLEKMLGEIRPAG